MAACSSAGKAEPGPPLSWRQAMAWRRFFFCSSFSWARLSCRREAPPAEAQNDAEIAVPVAAQPARRGSLRAIIRTTGVVTPAAGAEFIVTAPEPARIVEIPPAEGDRVARGDVLVRFDVPSAAAEAARHARGHRAGAGAARKRARRAGARARARRARHHLAAGNGERGPRAGRRPG